MVSGTDPRESGARLAGSSSEQTDGCDGADPDVTIIRRGGAASSGIIELVETDRSAAERWRARSSDASPAVVVERIQDDSELIEVLAAADHPTGLIRMEGDVRFTNPKLN